jgi:hypothetical protein
MLVNDNNQSRIVLKGAGIIKKIIILPVPYLDFAG